MSEVWATTIGELMDWLHEHPPEHYEPDHDVYDLCCPARLIYPEYVKWRPRRRTR